ncbi:hypothetical protein V6R21_32115 [Limibacter armeniacum]|uniref:hypothetical protein n=1 Tax=Limibacter armeniacum TaxID=466084 RepID=UPI002FE5731E
MSRILFLFLVLCAFFIQPTIAQKNFKDGHILVNETDTLYGQIEDANYYKNSILCNFKERGTDTVVSYKPEEIYGYRFEKGKFYISKVIQEEGARKAYFFEYLIDGELDFYLLQNEGRVNQYYVANDTTELQKLVYEKQTVTVNGKQYEKVSKPYTYLLKSLTVDVPEMQESINQMNKPDYRKVIKFGTTYHGIACPEQECLVYRKKNKLLYILEVGADTRWFSKKLDVEGENPSPFVGAIIHINNPEFSEKSYFGIGYYQEVSTSNQGEGVQKSRFKIPVTYGYIPPQKGVHFIFSGGINYNEIGEEMPFISMSVAPGIKVDMGKLYLKTYLEMDAFLVSFVPNSDALGYYITSIGASLNYKLN